MQQVAIKTPKQKSLNALGENLGSNIRSLRDFYRLNQCELAAIVGRNRQWLGRIERGESVMDAVYLPAIARALRCTPEELIDYDLRD